MLQTEEVDDDFFTPIAGTSLAHIFGNVSKNTEETENSTLKYVPPKPQTIPPKPVQKPEQNKATECIYACALIVHEWNNTNYTSRGKLGFAIVKIQKTGDHNIVLYDSNKVTLSCIVISPKLVVNIKNDTYISYFDNCHKYWSMYATQEETKKISEILKNLGANLTYSTYTEKGPPEPGETDNEVSVSAVQTEQIDKGSDTDSSVNRKTKASILNRMANMGHSVLPTRAPPAERTSDSSDTNDNQPKTVRHKPIKNIAKKVNIDTFMHELQTGCSESNQKLLIPSMDTTENVPTFMSFNGQLLPFNKINVAPGTSNELGMFISEQRMNNSELRINMNRITDKVDLVLDKINNINNFESRQTNIQTDILMKLVTEYENKIKVYEELLKSRGMGDMDRSENLTVLHFPQNDKESEILKNKISEIEKLNNDKNSKISDLQGEIIILKENLTQSEMKQANMETELLDKIIRLEKQLKEKSSTNTNHDDIGDKVKNIMNETFQTIVVNFKNDTEYSGEIVKKIIATVIKKITIAALSEL